jgi:hypothetical protein
MNPTGTVSCFEEDELVHGRAHLAGDLETVLQRALTTSLRNVLRTLSLI